VTKNIKTLFWPALTYVLVNVLDCLTSVWSIGAGEEQNVFARSASHEVILSRLITLKATFAAILVLFGTLVYFALPKEYRWVAVTASALYLVWLSYGMTAVCFNNGFLALGWFQQ
jgi:hypothetical protein